MIYFVAAALVGTGLLAICPLLIRTNGNDLVKDSTAVTVFGLGFFILALDAAALIIYGAYRLIA